MYNFISFEKGIVILHLEKLKLSSPKDALLLKWLSDIGGFRGGNEVATQLPAWIKKN